MPTSSTCWASSKRRTTNRIMQKALSQMRRRFFVVIKRHSLTVGGHRDWRNPKPPSLREVDFPWCKPRKRRRESLRSAILVVENIRLRCPKFAHLAFARRISTAALAYRSLYLPQAVLANATPVIFSSPTKVGRMRQAHSRGHCRSHLLQHSLRAMSGQHPFRQGGQGLQPLSKLHQFP